MDMERDHLIVLLVILVTLLMEINSQSATTVAVPSTSLAFGSNATSNNANTSFLPTTTEPFILIQDPTQTPLDAQANIPENIDLAVCVCDLTQDVCDVNCCCDENCSPSDRVVFLSCDDEYLTKETNTDLCSYDIRVYGNKNVMLKAVKNSYIFCISNDRNPSRKYYASVAVARNQSEFESYLASSQSNRFSYQYKPTVLEPTNETNYYKRGQFLITLSNNRVSTLDIPTSVAATSSCVKMNPAKFLISEEDSCTRNLVAPLEVVCTTSADLNSEKLRQNLQNVKVKMRPGSNTNLAVNVSVVDVDVKGDTQFPTYSPQLGLCIGIVKEVAYTVTHEAGVIMGVEANIVMTDLPGTLTAVEQKYSVQYVEAGDSSIPYRRSGNPGYLVGEPVIAGKRVGDYIRLNGDRQQYLSMVVASADGDCLTDSLNRQSIVFGEGFRSGCTLRLTKDNLGDQCSNQFGDQCSSLNAYVIQSLLGPSRALDTTEPIYIAMFGNSLPSKVGDWIELEIVSNEISEQTVGVSLHLDIIYINVGSLANPQAMIVAAKLYLEPISMSFSCVGPYCHRQNIDKTQNFEVVSSVAFIDNSLPAEAAIAEKPVAKSKLKADFFKPYYVASSSSQFFLSHVILCFIFISYLIG